MLCYVRVYALHVIQESTHLQALDYKDRTQQSKQIEH